jgi:hypothetical protein
LIEGSVRASIILAVLFTIGLLAPRGGAAPSIADEVRRMRSEVESMLKAADEDRRRVPDLEKEAATEKEKAAALAQDLARLKAEVASVQKSLAAAEAEVKAAEAEAQAEKQKGEALTGFQKQAWDLLAKNPKATQADLVRLALEASLEETLLRITAEPAARAGEAFEELAKSAAEPIAAPLLTEIAERARPAPELPAKADAVAALDTLAEMIDVATHCSGLSAPEVALPDLHSVPKPAAAQNGLTALLARVRGAVNARRLAAAAQGEAAIPRMQPAVGAPALTRAIARAAVARGSREVAWEAARAALGTYHKLRLGKSKVAPIPGAAKALLRRIERDLGVDCKPETLR